MNEIEKIKDFCKKRKIKMSIRPVMTYRKVTKEEAIEMIEEQKKNKGNQNDNL